MRISFAIIAPGQQVVAMVSNLLPMIGFGQYSPAEPRTKN
jgi:hypothetical protein